MNSKFLEVVRLLPVKVFLLFVGLWLLGLTLSVLAMTDLFSEPLFKRKNTMMIYLNISSSVMMISLIVGYFVGRRKRNPKSV